MHQSIAFHFLYALLYYIARVYPFIDPKNLNQKRKMIDIDCREACIVERVWHGR